jgi:class 3 adenylate cyclase
MYAKIAELLDNGQVFVAYDLAVEALKEPTLSSTDELRLRIYAARALLQSHSPLPAKEFTDSIAQVIQDSLHPHPPEAWITLLNNEPAASASTQFYTAEDLYHLGQIYWEIWSQLFEDTSSTLTPQTSLNDIRLALQFFCYSYYWRPNVQVGAMAASTAWALGEDQLSIHLANLALNHWGHQSFDDYTTAQALGTIHLLRHSPESALTVFTQAMTLARQQFSDIARTRHHLYMLNQIGLKVPGTVFQVLKPPSIAVFSGHNLDIIGQKIPIFPASLEDLALRGIETAVEKLQPQIGYTSLAAGGDILFAETLLKHGAELNIVLPFKREDFLAHRVAYAGPRWQTRAEHLLQHANSVNFATMEDFLGHQMLYRFGNYVLRGLAEIRANILETKPYLITLWHSKISSTPGTVSDFIDYWSDISTLHMIDLETLLQSEVSKIEQMYADMPHLEYFAPQTPVIEPDHQRQIRCMLFSDFAGFSKIPDRSIGDFMQVIEEISEDLAKNGIKAEVTNTWGDALFMVAERATDMALLGLTLRDAVHSSLAKRRFPVPLDIRISLHAGPVFKEVDPFIQRENFYGGHINRAARLEPVTIIGQIFATQQFIALLQTELSILRNENPHSPLLTRFKYRYVGTVELAKNYGTQPIYQLI